MTEVTTAGLLSSHYHRRQFAPKVGGVHGNPLPSFPLSLPPLPSLTHPHPLLTGVRGYHPGNVFDFTLIGEF